jgi:hypothetical protein
MCVCGTHVQGPSYYRPPPPPPGPCVPTSGALVTGKGAGSLLVSSRLIRSCKGFPWLWSITIWHGICHIWRTTLNHRGNARASAPEPETMFWAATEVGGRMGGGSEKGGMSGGGRGMGWGIICANEVLASLLSWEKTMGPLFWNLHTHATLPGMLQLLHAYDL